MLWQQFTVCCTNNINIESAFMRLIAVEYACVTILIS